MELRGKTINFLGDSITEGVGASGPAQGFVCQLAGMSGAKCRNYGIAGTRIARKRTPSDDPAMDEDFCRRSPRMDPAADLVAVFGGTNDFGHGDAPLGDPQDKDPTTFYGALRTLYESLAQSFSAARIVVATPMHRAVETRPGWPDLCEYVEAIRYMADLYGFPVLDLYQKGIPRRCIPDGLHPNDEGHRLLAEIFLQFFKAL